MIFTTFDAAYLERIRQGDRTAEEHFYKYFSELIVLKLRSRGWRREEIDEVIQETFARTFKLINSPGGVHAAERLGALVNSICNNVMRERYRAGRRVEPLEDDVAALLVEPRADALAKVISNDTSTVVTRVLDGMGERDRNLLRGLLLEEDDKDEICVRLGVNREYLRVLLHRAKQTFRDLYTETTTGSRLKPGPKLIERRPQIDL